VWRIRCQWHPAAPIAAFCYNTAANALPDKNELFQQGDPSSVGVTKLKFGFERQILRTDQEGGPGR
jgi:hypothetical protein